MDEWGIIDDRVEDMTLTEVKAVLAFLLKNTKISYTGEPMPDSEALLWIDNAILGMCDKNRFINSMKIDKALPRLPYSSAAKSWSV